MRRLLAWLGAAAGGLALYRLVRRRRPGEPREWAEAPVGDERARALREKLEASRAVLDEREAFEEGETRVDDAVAGPSPDERRRDVHERGRATMDEMRSPRRSDA